MPSRTAQLDLPRTAGWGGRRRGAGRKPAGDRAGVPHTARPPHQARLPVHATLRALPTLGSLRACPVFNHLEAAIGAASCAAFRIVHFSVQRDHVHLLVEAHDRTALLRGLRGFAIRAARAVNRALDRRGRVWADRYHARALRTPREVRHALCYVLHNWKKQVPGALRLDPCSSACWFDGWRGPRPRWSLPPAGAPPPVRAPRTWLLARGWRRLGLLALDARPRGAAAA